MIEAYSLKDITQSMIESYEAKLDYIERKKETSRREAFLISIARDITSEDLKEFLTYMKGTYDLVIPFLREVFLTREDLYDKLLQIVKDEGKKGELKSLLFNYELLDIATKLFKDQRIEEAKKLFAHLESVCPSYFEDNFNFKKLKEELNKCKT